MTLAFHKAEVVHESTTCSQDKCKAWEPFSWNFDLLIKNENVEEMKMQKKILCENATTFSDFTYWPGLLFFVLFWPHWFAVYVMRKCKNNENIDNLIVLHS